MQRQSRDDFATPALRPWPVLAAIIAVQALCWIAAPMLVADAPPLDVIENTVWGTEHILISYKNPALSSLMLEAARLMTGAIGWPAYVLSQMCIAVTFLCVFLLGREPLGDARALAGTILLTACYYFGWHTPEFNQDILEMPFWAATSLALWRAVDRNTPIWWIALGAIAAGSLYGKLSAAVLLAAAGLWLLIDPKARGKFTTYGPWLALAVFAAVVAPLANALAHGGLAAIAEYAVGRGNRHAANVFKWLGLQTIVVLPMALVAWICGYLTNTPNTTFKKENAGGALALNNERFTFFLLWMTLAPIFMTMLAAIVEGTGDKFMWGVPMMNLVGLLLVAHARSEITDHALRRLTVISVALILSVAAAFAASTYYRPQLTAQPSRQNWPQTAIAQRFRQIWQTETGVPLRIVAGDAMNWVSGLIALSSGDIASVLTSADYSKSPWITPDRVAREGMLVVWPDVGKGLPKELAAIAGGSVQRYEEFPLSRPGRAKSVRVGYVVIPPAK